MIANYHSYWTTITAAATTRYPAYVKLKVLKHVAF